MNAILSVPTLATVSLALGASLALTPLVRAIARRCGMVTRPRADRWAKKPTALLGGVAIFLSVTLASLTVLPSVEHGWAVLGASAFLFLVGLVDDFLNVKPYQKLIGQVVGAAVLILSGLTLPWTSSPLLNMGITLFWLVGITNAVNLLDNMDGLAAGVCAIAAAFLATSFLAGGQIEPAVVLAAFAAALVGFLMYNSNPASIFMGDCGSMFIGFFLASMALLHVSSGRSRSLLPVLAVPVLLLLIPIFDTTFVTILRKLAGRPASQGGRDHTSHRLVALGLSERRAVLLLYGLATVAGAVAVFVRDASADLGVAVLGALTVGLTILGIRLAGVKVYDTAEEVDGKKPVVAFLVDLSYKRRVFEVILDIGLITLAFYAANRLYFGELGERALERLFLNVLPIMLVLKLAGFLAAGVYRGLWRYVGTNDIVVYGQGVLLGSVLCVLAVVVLFRFQGFSRTVFLLDALLLLALLSASRGAFRLIRTLLPDGGVKAGRRVLIYGAGDAGEMLLCEMRNNPNLACVPVGFADDDPSKKGRVIHGLTVFGGNGSLPEICRQQGVEEVYISSVRFSDERVGEILEQCRQTGVGLKRMRISFETLDDGDREGQVGPSDTNRQPAATVAEGA
jgi:UDP-GlcNAc:undecaprenyl-phosphate GlcNAc-1-phosphate transferase